MKRRVTLREFREDNPPGWLGALYVLSIAVLACLVTWVVMGWLAS